ncbi:Hsp20 family protein [Ponticaulis profundi]|uniref:Hsp20 family protein n=1 Tax=Ponticaulis profundi TaxID=2665222 RepID=A0ABW1SBF7_9PROT
MQTIDLTPVYRTMVGFDRVASMIDAASRLDGSQGYPPYNIEKTGDNDFRIELAVAGFGEEDLDIETKEGVLTVTGKTGATEDGEKREFLHRGIAERSFIRRFQLADHVVVNGAELRNGLLRIELQRQLPEAMKPRKIAIGGHSKVEQPKVIEGNKNVA